MGLLDGIGLLVVILLAIAGCSYCYSRCCHRSRAQRNPRPKRHRRQKNARRKRRRHRYQRNDNPQSRPPNAAAASQPPSQCIVDIYPEQPPPQGLMFPQQFPSQVHAPPPQYQHYQSYHQQGLSAANFPPGGQMPQAGHALYGQLPPPPYEYHQPQGQFQNCPQPDASFFGQAPPPPYDTQLRPQSQQNSHFEQGDKKC